MWARLVSCVIVAIAKLACVANEVQAQPLISVSVNHPDAMALVLGISTGATLEEQTSKFDTKARSWVISGLQRWFPNYSVSKTALTDENLGCRTTECYVRLQNSHKADYVIFGSSAINPLNYSLQLVLIGANGAILKIVNKECPQCALEENRRRQYEEAVGELFQMEATPPPRAESKLPVARRRECTPYATFQRGIGVGATSALLLLGLTTTIMLASLNGKIYDAANNEEYDFANHAALSGGLTLLPLSGLGLALGLNRPDTTSAGAQAGQCRQTLPMKKTFLRGLALGALGSTAIAGLASTVTFSSMSGLHYDDQRQFDYKNPAIAAGVGTGLFIAGFLLSFPW